MTSNEFIEGRQFDVTIRFMFQDYTYLTIIECRHQRVKASDVEAFVTKARDAHADKSVIVSSKGFQRGAKNVAARHAILLHTLRQIDDLPEWVIIRAISPFISVTEISATTTSGIYDFPQWSNELTYAVTHATLTTPGKQQNVHDLLESHRQEWEPTLQKERPRRITLPCAATLQVPYEDPVPVTSISFRATLTTATQVETGGIDVNILTPSYEYRDAILGTARTVTSAGIPLGFDTAIAAGAFYEDPHTNVCFYIECIDLEGWATIHQVESYQHGQLVQCTYRQRLEPPYTVVPVTDEKRRARLQRMLAGMKVMPAVPVRPVQPNDACPCGSGTPLHACHGVGTRAVMLFETERSN